MAVVKTIGSAGGRDYSTIAAWIAALPANLVTDGNSQEGDCYNDSQFLEINTAFSGHTTDSTHTILLTTGAGQSFQDNVNVQTNALRYNQSNGVGVKNNGGYGAGYVLIVNDSNTTISKLQINNTIGRGMQGSAGSTFSSCIINSVSFPGVNGALWLNCLLTSTGDSNCLAGAAPSTLVNCTLVKTTDSASTQNAFTSGYSAAYITKNVAIFGFNGVVASATVTATTCMTDVASPPSGFTGSKTYANQFVDTGTTLGNRDFRAKAAADILDAGTTDTTDIPAADDIAKTSRPQGSAWDIGAWELVSSGAAANTNMLPGMAF